MKEEIPAVYHGLPVVTAAAMRLMDLAAAEKYGIAELQLMENAGKAVAEGTARYLRDALGREPGAARVAVCCGRGANGGDGLVAARILKGMVADVRVFLCPPRKEAGKAGPYPESVKANLQRALDAGVPVESLEAAGALAAGLSGAHVLLDALLGTGASGKPAGVIRVGIQAMNRSKVPVLAVDIPSGIHPDTGYHSGVYVTAALTFALGLPKRGLLAGHAKKYVGRLEVLDIGYPDPLLQTVSGE